MKRIILVFILVILFIPLYASAATICSESKEHREYEKHTEEEKNYYIAPVYCNVGDEEFTRSPTITLSAAASDSKYSSISSGFVTTPKHQYSIGACWAFSSLSLVESNALKNKLGTYDLSEAHMIYGLVSGGFSDDAGKNGRYYTTSMSGGPIMFGPTYFFNNKGMLSESEMPYPQTEKKIKSSEYPSGKKMLTVNQFDLFNLNSYGVCSTDEINLIKNQIINNGSVGVSIYMKELLFSDTAKDYYLATTSNSELPNHAVSLVGWDDTISKSKFNGATRNGAWIVKNSWGSSWSNDGYFYLSYDDYFGCKYAYSYSGVSKTTFDNTYAAADVVGLTPISFGSDISFASKFTKKTSGTETIKRVSFMSGANVDYKVYLAKDGNINNKNNFTLLGSGTSQVMGIKSVNVNGVDITSNYAIVIEFTVKNNSRNTIYTMCNVSSYTSHLSYSTGTNYYGSVNKWNDLASFSMFDVNGSTMTTKCEPNIYVYSVNKGGSTTTPTTNPIEVVNSSKVKIDSSNNITFTFNRTDSLTLNNITSYLKLNSSYTVYNGSTNITDNTKALATGYKITIDNKNYFIVIKGDVNSDGKITALDYIEIRKHIMGTKITDTYKVKAADLDNNNNLTALDYIAIRKILMA